MVGEKTICLFDVEEEMKFERKSKLEKMTSKKKS
jgi:hypothetical protein